MKKILVVNQGHTKNYGDVAINSTISKFFEEKNLEVDCIPYWEETLVFGKNYKKIPYRIISIIMNNTFLVDFFNRRAIKKQIKNKNYDAVIIGGGELIGNHDGFNSSLNVITKIFQKKNIPVYLLGVSGDVDITDKAKRRYKEALNRCKQVIVRDAHTEKICKETYKTDCKKGTDVVFAYLKVMKDNFDIEKEDKKDITILVPISYNKKIKETLNIKTKEDYYEYILNLVRKNISKTSKLVITSSVLDDEKCSKEIYEYLKKSIKENEIEFIEYTNLDKFIELLKLSTIVISARMHAMILGLIYGNKVEVIPFKTKLKVFKEEYQDIDTKKLNTVQENTYKELEELYDEINNK